MHKNTRRLHILLAEDDESDVQVTRRAIEKAGIAADLTVVHDGQAVIDYIFHSQDLDGMSKPDLVLMDLHLPKLGGMDVLAMLKQNSDIVPIPIIILSTSDRQDDIHTAYALGANTYIIKPIHFSDFVQVMKNLATFWSRTACLL